LPCGDALAEGFEAPHPLPGNGLLANHERVRLDPASCMVSGPALPECPAVVPGGAQGFVSEDRGGEVLFPRSPILADGDDRGGLPVDPSCM